MNKKKTDQTNKTKETNSNQNEIFNSVGKLRQPYSFGNAQNYQNLRETPNLKTKNPMDDTFYKIGDISSLNSKIQQPIGHSVRRQENINKSNAQNKNIKNEHKQKANNIPIRYMNQINLEQCMLQQYNGFSDFAQFGLPFASQIPSFAVENKFMDKK